MLNEQDAANGSVTPLPPDVPLVNDKEPRNAADYEDGDYDMDDEPGMEDD